MSFSRDNNGSGFQSAGNSLTSCVGTHINFYSSIVLYNSGSEIFRCYWDEIRCLRI